MPFLDLFKTGESVRPCGCRLNTCSLSAIIISRFQLDLRRNAQPNTGLPTISIVSFRAASQRVHDAIMEEFGGSLGDDSVEAEATRDEIVTPDPDISSGTTEDDIELEEVLSGHRVLK